MATISLVAQEEYLPNTRVILWETLTSADTDGSAFESDLPDKSVQIVGTFGTATLVIEGSNDGTNYITLSNPSGADLTFTGAGLEQVSEFTRYIRPNVSGADGTTDLDVYLVARG